MDKPVLGGNNSDFKNKISWNIFQLNLGSKCEYFIEILQIEIPRPRRGNTLECKLDGN